MRVGAPNPDLPREKTKSRYPRIGKRYRAAAGPHGGDTPISRSAQTRTIGLVQNRKPAPASLTELVRVAAIACAASKRAANKGADRRGRSRPGMFADRSKRRMSQARRQRRCSRYRQEVHAIAHCALQDQRIVSPPGS